MLTKEQVKQELETLPRKHFKNLIAMYRQNPELMIEQMLKQAQNMKITTVEGLGSMLAIMESDIATT